MFPALNSIMMGGREVLPLVEGGKGVSATNGASSGAWAAAGGVGTISAVNADSYDSTGNIIPQVYYGKTRRDRHEELINYAIAGGIAQIRRAFEIASERGAININVLWEMGGAQRILHSILEQTKGLVNGVTCGAGMPYKLSEIAAQYGVYYYPIVSSARAFRALWKRAYRKVSDLMGAVVYEDPWLAGGHTGLSNAEDPNIPQPHYSRVRELRETMRSQGIKDHIPIIVAGGVWYLRDWVDWIDNPELGQIVFQFGTRPLLTRESPIPDSWKRALLNIRKGDVYLQKFSPTGFYSSAVRNDFMHMLEERSARQISIKSKPDDEHCVQLEAGNLRKKLYVSQEDFNRSRNWVKAGYGDVLVTPDQSVVFVTPQDRMKIKKDQSECMGCLSHCSFSSWVQDDKGKGSGRLADPRSYCIQKSLQAIAHEGDVDNNLMFAGYNAFEFSQDPLYSNGYIPKVKELIARIMTGN